MELLNFRKIGPGWIWLVKFAVSAHSSKGAYLGTGGEAEMQKRTGSTIHEAKAFA